MVENVIEGVKPTRMELLAIRKKKKLAEKGHKLLGEKRDALVMQFFEIIRTRDVLRNEVNSKLKEAYNTLIDAEMIMGRDNVADVTYSIPEIPDIPTDVVNIMGVQVPRIQSDAVKMDNKPLYGYLHTSARLDEATDRFQNVLMQILKLAEVEGSIERLANEIEKTKRRVNALEHIFIPRLNATQKYIEMQLQEREREDFFRRKRIKTIMEAQKG
ncbi:V-type ATP synthase subunit D [[Eubacterium] cellulosolvens]